MNLGNYQKTPLASSFNRLAAQAAATAIQQQGKALPCSVVAVAGQIVTVKFEVDAAPQTLQNVTIPLAAWVYDWIPVQVGDAGVTVPADAYLGGISGLGGGTATMTPRANLTALVFVPCANKSWTVPDPDQRVTQGPHGVLVRTADGTSSVDVTASAITMICQGHTLIVNSAGFSFDGIIFGTHVHPQPNDSHGDTEFPTGAPENP